MFFNMLCATPTKCIKSKLFLRLMDFPFVDFAQFTENILYLLLCFVPLACGGMCAILLSDTYRKGDMVKMEKQKTYNGVIDWWKFVFCTVILIMHVGEYFNEGFYLLKYGRYAVEFFFIVSGYFMCAHAMRQDASEGCGNIGDETIGFIAGKIRTVLPAYLYAWLLALAMYLYKTGFDILKNDGIRAFALKIVHALPNLLLLDMGGIKSTEVLGVSWYVSAMLIVMFITYPMLRKWGRNYCLIAAPMIALLLSGFYSSRFGEYHSKHFWTGLMVHGLMRGFISINIGCLAYVLSRFISDRFEKLGSFEKTLVRITEPISYLCAIALMHYGNDMSANIINILFLTGVSVTMSGQSLFSGMCDNNICRLMGKLSLWIYFCQSPARMFVLKRFPNCSYQRAFVLIFSLTALITAAGMGVHALSTKSKKHSS